jgi:hypothetical protein
MKFLDYEAAQAHEAFKSVALANVGFIAGVGGSAASLKVSCDPFYICVSLFVVGFVCVVIGRQKLAKKLREKAMNISSNQNLATLDAAVVWAAVFEKEFESYWLDKAREILILGIVSIGIVLVLRYFKFICDGSA